MSDTTNQEAPSVKQGLPALVPAIVLSLIVGGVIGFYVRYFSEAYGGASPQTATSSAGGPGSGGGMMGGGPGGMGGGQPRPGMMLAGMVRNLGTIEKVQSKGLTVDQGKAILPILQELKKADKLSDQDAEAKTKQIEAALGDPQKEALQAVSPPRRGGMGGGMSGGMGGAMARPMMSGGSPASPGSVPPTASGGAPGGPRGSGGGPMAMGGGPGGMGGGRPDPERPFASERNKQALDDLITLLETRTK